MKHKTERGDRGHRIDVLTNSGDGRRWPDFEVNAGGGGSVWAAGSVRAAHGAALRRCQGEASVGAA
jgi:hypothetical protein